MTKLNSAISYAILALSLSWSFFVDETVADEPKLEIVLDSNIVPAIATVVGPQKLLDQIAADAKRRKGCAIQQLMGGSGFNIVWGDDDIGVTSAEPVIGPDGCEDWTKHRYTVPGNYQIWAFIAHPGPADAPIVEWQSSAAVTVGGMPKPLDFSFVERADDATCFYPPVAWTLTTGAPADLTLELIGGNGQTVASRTLTGLTYSGRGETTLWFGGSECDALTKNGLEKVRIRATVSSLGQKLVRENQPFGPSSGIPFSWHENQPRASMVTDHPPRRIALSHLSFPSACHGYLIDWGDGSPVERSAVVKGPGECDGEKTWNISIHTYAQAGTYTIVYCASAILSSCHFTSPFYQQARITVP